MRWSRLWIGAVLISAALPAVAQVDFYAGANLGVTDYEFTDEGAVSLSGVFGVYMTPYLSAEVGVLNLGELDEYLDADDSSLTEETLSVNGVNVAVRGVIPLDEQVELYGKVGIFLWRAPVEEDNDELFESADGQNISGGIGLTWLLTPNFGLNLEWQRFDLEDFYANNTSVGVRLEF